MIIAVREIPIEGLHLVGEIQKDVFELDPKDAKPAGPISYELNVSIVSEGLLVQGKLSIPFQLFCVRCLEPFTQTIHRDNYIFHRPIETRVSIDLTDSIREDILLALPIHPHCEDGRSKGCPAANRFEKPESESEASDEREAWADLEGFQPPSPE